MKIENLSVGDVFKNYKELCAALEMKIANGASKRAQIKELERFCSYEKKGNSFIITEIYEEPITLIKGNNSLPFIDEMEILILNTLIKSNQNHYTISNSRLLLELYMINPNYTKFFNKRSDLSEILKMNVEYVNEFLDATNTTFKAAINSACKRLENRKLIIHERVMMVHVIDPNVQITPNGYANITDIFYYDIVDDAFKQKNTKPKQIVREATEQEKQLIVAIENEIMRNEFKCREIVDIYLNGHAMKYYRRVNEELYDRLNIKSHYMANRFTINYEAIRERSITYLPELEEIEKQKELNMKLIERLLHNKDKRVANAENGKGSKRKLELRLNDDYSDSIVLLTDSLIKSEYKELKKQVNKKDSDIVDEVPQYILDNLPDMM